ncbi:hypothetical protein ABXT08_09940 [Chryseobacterium sp. NRRL B-14859]|uniref:hypothetical protein n=1 Tax=Chryseobacterium sp. NRRL B-14859 TaxID=1562763 RepID=UPI003398ED2E
MKKLESLTKDQLYTRIKNTSEKLYPAVYSTLENTFFNETLLDEDSLSDFLEMLDEETAEKIKESSFHIDDDVPEIWLIENESKNSLDLLVEEGEGYKIILIENDIHLSGNLFIEEYVVLIVTGNIQAANIIVNGSLYCAGNLSCNVLFGASSNDNETVIGGSILVTLVAENGHYTVAKGNIYSKYLISFHNEIEGNTGKFIENISIERPEETIALNPEILDQEGYFDEELFLHFITYNKTELLFR